MKTFARIEANGFENLFESIFSDRIGMTASPFPRTNRLRLSGSTPYAGVCKSRPAGAKLSRLQAIRFAAASLSRMSPRERKQRAVQRENARLAREYAGSDFQPRRLIDGRLVWLNFAQERERMAEQELLNAREERRAAWLKHTALAV